LKEVARVCCVLFLLNTADGMVSTLASAYAGSLGYSLTDIGLLVSLYSITSLVSRLPAARLADGRFAHQWLLVACLALAASLALYPVATQPSALWSVRLLHGLSFGVATTLNFATFLAVCSNTNRAFATALFTASWSGGYSVGNFASGVIADNFGYGPSFLLSAIFPLLAIVTTPAVKRVAMPTTGDPRRLTLRLLLSADVRAVPLLAFSVNFLNGLLTTLFPLYVLAIGQTLSVVGTARALQSLTNTLVRPISGSVIQRVGPLQLGSAGVALTALAIVALPLSTVPLILLGLFVVVGVGRAVGVVANASGTVDLAERGVLKRGMASALMTAGGDFGNVAAPLLAGATAAAIGLGEALQVLAVGAAVLGIASLLGAGSKHEATAGLSASA
jgi:MFS family permease